MPHSKEWGISDLRGTFLLFITFVDVVRKLSYLCKQSNHVND